MKGISDPDLYQLSEIVEKSSKTGIFSNTRLLMIKDGFLYYYSKVPEGYKGQEVNVMASLKQYPKSSIQIKAISQVRLESQKSSTLIIQFSQKDMIDRQDIRKSVSSKNFNHPIKDGTVEVEQWRFTFANFGKCKQWYNALQTLKAHFVQNQDKPDKFTQYMANFDNDLRQSLPRYSHNQASPLYSHKNETVSNGDVWQGGNSASAGGSSKAHPSMKAQLQNNPAELAHEVTQSQTLNERYKSNIVAIQEVEQQEDDLVGSIRLPLPLAKQQELRLDTPPVLLEEDKPSLQLKNQLPQQVSPPTHIEPSHEAISEAIQAASNKIRRQERQKAAHQATLLEETLLQKQKIIESMSQQLESAKKTHQELHQKVQLERTKREIQESLRIDLECQKKQEDAARLLKQEEEASHMRLQSRRSLSIEQTLPKAPEFKQQSIQTETQKLIQEHLASQQNSEYEIDGASEELETFKCETELRIQYLQEALTQRESAPCLSTYDYFWQMSQLYIEVQTSLRVEKELALARFVRMATEQVSSIVRSYLDIERPSQSVKLDRHIFQIEIVCSQGRLINVSGSQRLLYANQEHQRLKRTFKNYQQLNEIVLSNLKKKPNYPLRVPFCSLTEYKGYTAIALIVPACLQPSKNVHHLRTLGPEVPAYNLRVFDFSVKGVEMTLLTVAEPYKSTKQDEISLLKYHHQNLDFVELNRQSNISIDSKKLFEEASSAIHNTSERLLHAKTISCCRQLKRQMRASVPFSEYPQKLHFFEQFLQNPGLFYETSANYRSPPGILLYYCSKLLGIESTGNLWSPQASYQVSPVVRGLLLSSLDIAIFATKMQKLCAEGKWDLSELALKYSRQLDYDHVNITLKEIVLDVCQGRHSSAFTRIQTAEQRLFPYDPRRLKLLEYKAQCCKALCQEQDVLSTLSRLLTETEYIYQEKSKLIDVYFLIAGALSRRNLNKQLVAVYRKIIKESPPDRHRVIVNFSQTLLNQEADPHVLLDFVQKQSEMDCELPGIQVLLGQLYMRCRNFPKALNHFSSAFESMTSSSQPQPVLLDIYRHLMKLLPSLTQKRTASKQLATFAQYNQPNAELSSELNTCTIEHIIEHIKKSDRRHLVNLISRKLTQKEQGQSYSNRTRVHDWLTLEQMVGAVLRTEGSPNLDKLLQSINGQVVVQNNRQLH